MSDTPQAPPVAPKAKQAFQAQLPGVKKYSSLKEAFNDVKETMGQIHVDVSERLTQNRRRGV